MLAPGLVSSRQMPQVVTLARFEGGSRVSGPGSDLCSEEMAGPCYMWLRMEIDRGRDNA